MKVAAMQHHVLHFTKCFSSVPASRPLQAWCTNSSAASLRSSFSSVPGCVGLGVFPSRTRCRSFSLDQLRQTTIQDAPVEEAVRVQVKDEEFPEAEEQPQSSVGVDTAAKVAVRQRDIGAFQQLPVVSPGYEILGTAVRRAKMIKPTKGILNAAKRERNRGAKQLDALTKELTIPLKNYIRSFPGSEQLHPYEQSLLELTLGPGTYEETLQRVDLLRKKVLDSGKNHASVCAKSTSKREAGERLDEGFSRLEELFNKHGKAVDDLKEIAKVLRAMPVVHPRTPTLCLVGAPNVGKSSLVRVLSSGKPEVCNYPFTTRGISMGHFFVDAQRYQVTDTPGLLKRPDEERNNIEKLTLAALAHLPTAVLYVHDLTGECGTTVLDQLVIYKDIKERFAGRPWLDVISKADLLPPSAAAANAPVEYPALYELEGPANALRVSVETGQGLDELVQKVHTLLVAHSLTLHGQSGDNLPQKILTAEKEKQVKQVAFYSPAWPHVQG